MKATKEAKKTFAIDVSGPSGSTVSDPKETNPGPGQASNPPRALTSEETAIVARIMGQDASWENIRPDMVEDFSLMDDPMPFPREAIEREKQHEFKYRWIECKPARIDQITKGFQVPRRWWLCNSSNTPYLKNDIDPITGGIHSLGQILVFKPWWMHEMVQRAKDELNEAQNNKSITARDGTEQDGKYFYAGEQYKIGNKDEVQYDEAVVEGEGDVYEGEDILAAE